MTQPEYTTPDFSAMRLCVEAAQGRARALLLAMIVNPMLIKASPEPKTATELLHRLEEHAREVRRDVNPRRIQRKHIPTIEVLRQQQLRWDNPYTTGWTYQVLAERHGWPEKVVYAKMMQMADQGYLEYGVSLRTAWLTHKGKAFLAAGK